jgi:hypothetical protein
MDQITFGAINFHPHKPTLAPIFASLDQEMDLMIGSFNFHVQSLGSVCLSDPTKPGPSAGRTTIAATPEASVGSPSKVNSPVSIKPARGDTVKELDKIMENLDLKESSGYRDMSSDRNSINSSKQLLQRRFHDLLWQHLQPFKRYMEVRTRTP